jgi:hypothetical protein
MPSILYGFTLKQHQKKPQNFKPPHYMLIYQQDKIQMKDQQKNIENHFFLGAVHITHPRTVFEKLLL